VLKYDLVPRVGMTHQFVPWYVHGSCYTSELFIWFTEFVGNGLQVCKSTILQSGDGGHLRFEFL
jgi:lysozyme family protein